MSESQANSLNLKAVLDQAYAQERARLSLLTPLDDPQGDYDHPVFGCGNPEADMMFVGEAPGREEAERGEPFVGRAGRQLDALFALSGLSRTEAYVTNVVKYRPVIRSTRSLRNRTPGKKEIAQSLKLLQTEILAIQPRCIITLGNTPLLALLALADSQVSGTIGALHGKPLPITVNGLQAELFPLYHPASGIYNRMLLPVMEQDILALGEHLVKAR